MKRFTKLGLFALAIFFSQVYPFVHFHHDHAEAHTSIAAHLFSLEVDPYHAHHGHNHDSSHEPADNHGHDHEFSQHVDWHIVRTHSNPILSIFNFVFVSIQANQTSESPSSTKRRHDSTTPLPDSVVLDGIEPRGPPVLVCLS